MNHTQDPVTAISNLVRSLTPGSVKNLLARSKAVACGGASYLAYEMGQGLPQEKHVLLVMAPLAGYVLSEGLIDLAFAIRGMARPNNEPTADPEPTPPKV